MEALKISSDALFILLGAVLVLAMHAGFAFLEVGVMPFLWEWTWVVRGQCRRC